MRRRRSTEQDHQRRDNSEGHTVKPISQTSLLQALHSASDIIPTLTSKQYYLALSSISVSCPLPGIKIKGRRSFWPRSNLGLDWLSDWIGIKSLLENISLGRVRALTRVQAKIDMVAIHGPPGPEITGAGSEFGVFGHVWWSWCRFGAGDCDFPSIDLESVPEILISLSAGLDWSR